MTWVLALVGLVLGAVVGDGEPLGWVGGALIGGLWGNLLGLRRELQALRAGRPHSAMDVIAPAPTAPASTAAPEAALPASGPESDASAPADVAASARVADERPEPLDPWTQPPPVVAGVSDDARAGAAATQPRQAAPGMVERLLALALGWLREGNLPVKLGMLVLFIGVAGLLRYAAERGVFELPIELRLAGVAAAGLAGLWFGWLRRERQRVFALSLQGGALGVLLLTVFAAFGLYRLLPAAAAFLMVLLLVAASGVLAVRQNALALAVLGSVGGFLAPVLISTGSGNHVALFSFYALLNLAVLGVAWVRPWRALNLVGFGFTFVVGSLWAYRYYRPEFYPTVQPFLILFFLYYLAIALLYALRSAHPPQRAVDGSLVFGTPLLAAGLQAGLLAERPLALAFSALLVAALYAALAWGLRHSQRLATLRFSFAVLAVGFATAAVPLALDAQVTAQIWALEGAALVWLGLHSGRRWQWWSGLALQAVAGGAWLLALDVFPHGAPAWRNGVFVGGVVLAAALGFSSLLLQRHRRASWIGWIWFVGMALIWGLTWLREIFNALPSRWEGVGILLWAGASALLAAWLRRRLHWSGIGALALLVQLGALLMALVGLDDQVFVGSRLLAWPLWALLSAAALALLARPWQRGLSWGHVLLLGIVAFAAGIELAQFVDRTLPQAGVWAGLAALLPLSLLFAFALPPRLASGWPLGARFAEYRWRWLLPAGVALGLAFLLSLWSRGAADPLPFLPLLNPLELAQLAVLALLLRAAMLAPRFGHRGALLLAVPTGFAWLTAATLRAVHHLGGVPWNDALARSMLSQTSLTVVWSILGVIAWIAGSRRGHYPLWLGGAILLGVVLVKLVLVDRQHMGNMPGIVSFLAVGALLTVIGYLAPSPPRGVNGDSRT